MPFCRSSIGGGAPTIPGSVPDGISLATPRSESFQRLRGHQVSCRLFLGFICGVVVFVRTTGDFNFVDEMRVNTSEEKLAVPLPLFCELHPLAKRAFSILGGIAGYLKGAGLVRVCAWFTCVCVCVNFLSVQYLVCVCVNDQEVLFDRTERSMKTEMYGCVSAVPCLFVHAYGP